MGAGVEERQQTMRGADRLQVAVFDAERLPDAPVGLFDPDRWPEPAVPVTAGGRGAAWFVRGGFGDGVLRHYRRGGLIARMLADRYLFLGQSRVRSVREFRLLALLGELGLPVPAPLAAGYRKHGLCYRADLLVERIAGAQSLAELLAQSPDRPEWAGIGRMIARFHRAGVQHADLNAHNVLMDRQRRHFLIDFDRGRLRPPAPGWRGRNLARLWRSLRKLRGAVSEAALRRRFDDLCAAYDDAYGDGP